MGVLKKSLIQHGGAQRPYVTEIIPDAGSNWGDWGSASFCPEGSWATGFQLKIAEHSVMTQRSTGSSSFAKALMEQTGERIRNTGSSVSFRGRVKSSSTRPRYEAP